jgi:hypothetical protein
MPENSNDYGALTIDTCIFDQQGIALEKGLFKQLTQFADSPIKLVFVDIIHNELKSHLVKNIKEARNKIQQALEACKTQCLSTDDQILNAKALIFGEGDDVEVAEKRLAAFYNNIGAEIIETHKYVDISRLLKQYFDILPPFENTKEKKNEFPDAFALLTLEKWAEEKNVKILAVSKDKGWIQFANNSDYIEVVENLKEAIAHFQSYPTAKDIFDELRVIISSGKNNDILAAITNAIRNSLDDATIEIFATSSYYYEEDDIYATYVEHRFIEDGNGLTEINLIRTEAGSIVLQLTAYVTCNVHCTFSFSVRDPIDKDDIYIGSNSLEVEENYLTDILITLSGDFSMDLNNVEIDEIEVLETVSTADFDNIEPNWGYEDE